MTDEQLYAFIDDKYANYVGRGDNLKDAIGSLVMGHYMGWHVLLICSSPNTFKKHEKILGLNFKEVMSERGRYSRRSLGLKIVDKMKNFWSVVQGRSSMNREDKVTLN